MTRPTPPTSAPAKPAEAELSAFTAVACAWYCLQAIWHFIWGKPWID